MAIGYCFYLFIYVMKEKLENQLFNRYVKDCHKIIVGYNAVQSNCPSGRDRCPNGKKEKSDDTRLCRFNAIGPKSFSDHQAKGGFHASTQIFFFKGFWNKCVRLGIDDLPEDLPVSVGTSKNTRVPELF